MKIVHNESKMGLKNSQSATKNDLRVLNEEEVVAQEQLQIPKLQIPAENGD